MTLIVPEPEDDSAAAALLRYDQGVLAAYGRGMAEGRRHNEAIADRAVFQGQVIAELNCRVDDLVSLVGSFIEAEAIRQAERLVRDAETAAPEDGRSFAHRAHYAKVSGCSAHRARR